MNAISKVFTDIFANNKWNGSSKSGPGSSLGATAPLREELSRSFSQFSIRILADAPCGTAEWIIHSTAGLRLYLGYDVVPELIEIARKTAGNRKNHLFDVADITVDVLPTVDAILCRDCLVHLPFQMANAAIKNFQASGSTYLLATTFPTLKENQNGTLGGWRPLNMQRAPFDFPEPVAWLRDRVPTDGDKYSDKSIGVWLLRDLPVRAPGHNGLSLQVQEAFVRDPNAGDL